MDVFSLHFYGSDEESEFRHLWNLSAIDLPRSQARTVHAARAPVFVGELGQMKPSFKEDPSAKWTLHSMADGASLTGVNPQKPLVHCKGFGFTAPMNAIGNLRASQLRQAADILEHIEGLQQQLGELLGSTPPPDAVPAATPKRKISAAGIARIRAAQKARWAKAKRAAEPTLPKRRMSPAARARLAALARARWKKVKAAGKSRL